MITKYFEMLKNIELNAGYLYFAFRDTNKEDSSFWWHLANEEFNHAALIQTCIEFLNNDIDVSFMIKEKTKNLKIFNDYLIDIKKTYLESPSRSKSFEIALNIESDTSETHFEYIMTNTNIDVNNSIITILRQLNKDDINHLERITNYYNKLKDTNEL